MNGEAFNHTLVVLDTAWGPSQLNKLFAINTTGNKSGRMLAKLMGTHRVLVGNACEKTTDHATKHGTPDTAYLALVCLEAVQRFNVTTFILGGKVAQETFAAMRADAKARAGCDPFPADGFRFIRIPHPAARFWTHDMMARATAAIADKSIKDFTLTK